MKLRYFRWQCSVLSPSVLSLASVSLKHQMLRPVVRVKIVTTTEIFVGGVHDFWRWLNPESILQLFL